ncbi:MAG: DUF3795 domain-containing protein [Spirochaetaceae bacterium]|nr:DUF3795 domain-containing protein [Spirochaetaceae bacterium]
MFDSYCGLKCAECDYKEKHGCKGCIASEGKPFWSSAGGECEVAQCAIAKDVRFCGECLDFPCKILNKYAFDKEQGDNGARIEHCKTLVAEMAKKARVGLNPRSVCGLHCDYCPYTERCGGCRSGYNWCSYATANQEKVCPNVKCAQEKDLEGCYLCNELEDCEKGFYSVEKFAKACAIFIKKYGEEKFGQTFDRAMEIGGKEFEAFGDNEAGSVSDKVKLLEKFMLPACTN